MQIGRVIGTVVATQKNPKYDGAKLLLVQLLTPDGAARGTPVLAVDSVGAGVSERVLVVQEGRAAGEALRRKLAPVDTAIVGIIDRVETGGDRPIPQAPKAEASERAGRRPRQS